MRPSIESNDVQTITNIVFGLTATSISIVTLCQGCKAWKIWRGYRQRDDATSNPESREHNVRAIFPNVALISDSDIELGLRSNVPLPHQGASLTAFEVSPTGMASPSMSVTGRNEPLPTHDAAAFNSDSGNDAVNTNDEA